MGRQRTATQVVEAPSAGPEVLPTGTGSDVQLDQSPTSGKSAVITGDSDSETDMDSEPRSPADDNFQGELPEGSDISWAGTRTMISTVLHLP